ncbi:MAG: hypothetical protein KGV44_14170 [Flavobacteriaceae bacterium]|nr:hypothetical protein [Flavobacteriaceae bacterium]
MKSLLYTAIKLSTFLGFIYGLSVIVTKEMVSIALLFIAFLLIKMFVSVALSIVFKLIKWLCIVGILGILFSAI